MHRLSHVFLLFDYPTFDIFSPCVLQVSFDNHSHYQYTTAMRHTYHLLFWLCYSRPFTVASPIQSINERYVDVDCHNEGSMFMSECWTRLGISDWLTRWNQTTPVCSDSSRCCSDDEPWSTCFLRLARGRGGQDCTTVDDQPCTWDNEVSEYLHPSIYHEVRYVVKSIYGVHDFFSSYFKGKTVLKILDPCMLWQAN